ncbi:hypothetical protein HYV69_01630 [Candidatus Uhrbacteria bacterium]|nr:hypothetical protein [Candidatus Uhrbacteria bacterium]
MTLRWFLTIMTLSTVAAWIGWVFVLNTTDPITTGLVGYLLFYLTLAIAFSGTTALFGTLIRIWFHPDGIPYRQTVRALRQSVIFTGLFVSAMILLSFDIMRWWSAILLVVLFSLIELLFSAHNNQSF